MRSLVGLRRAQSLRRMVMVVALSVWLASCTPAQYSAPSPKLNTFMVLVERDYETVWGALIDHISQTSFGIENFEKDSGLIVVSFSGSPNIFVDYGSWSWGGFQGSYIQWRQNTGQSMSLSGKINISVYKMEGTVTRVRVNARYVLTMRDLDGASDAWTFDSGSSDSVSMGGRKALGTDNMRTCRPTYKLESDILRAVKGIR